MVLTVFQPIPEDILFDPPCMVVRSSSINGQGLFVTKLYRKGEVLMVITGEVVDSKEARRRETEEGNCHIYLLDKNRFLDPAAGAMAKYLNHSCQPNAIPETRDECTLQLRALRDIAPEEEITIDYDFDEIYDLCRKDNAYCLQARCPAGVVACGTQGTSGRAVPEPRPA